MPAKAGGAIALALALPAGFAPAASYGVPAQTDSPDAGGVVERSQPAARPSLVEAARRQRERVAESRNRRGPAPRFTDADLPGGAAGAGGLATGPEDAERPDAGETTDSGAGPEERGEASDARAAAGEPEAADAEERESPAAPEGTETGGERKSDRERERELRERLLDVEASLAALGVSGLPFAPRNPNRFTSAFDAARLRAEEREIRRELRELADGAGENAARPR